MNFQYTISGLTKRLLDKIITTVFPPPDRPVAGKKGPLPAFVNGLQNCL